MRLRLWDVFPRFPLGPGCGQCERSLSGARRLAHSLWRQGLPWEVDMNVTVVESSTLATVGYDRTRELLQLEFDSGALYQYFRVSAKCIKPCCVRPPRAAISIRPFGGSSRILSCPKIRSA